MMKNEIAMDDMHAPVGGVKKKIRERSFLPGFMAKTTSHVNATQAKVKSLMGRLHKRAKHMKTWEK